MKINRWERISEAEPYREYLVSPFLLTRRNTYLNGHSIG